MSGKVARCKRKRKCFGSSMMICQASTEESRGKADTLRGSSKVDIGSLSGAIGKILFVLTVLFAVFAVLLNPGIDPISVRIFLIVGVAISVMFSVAGND